MVRPPTNTSFTRPSRITAETSKRDRRPISTPCSNTVACPLARTPCFTR